jgi:hypothetical protein
MALRSICGPIPERSTTWVEHGPASRKELRAERTGEQASYPPTDTQSDPVWVWGFRILGQPDRQPRKSCVLNRERARGFEPLTSSLGSKLDHPAEKRRSRCVDEG